MSGQCSNPKCSAPIGLCANSCDAEYRGCPNWTEEGEKAGVAQKGAKRSQGSSSLPWKGLELQKEDLQLIADRNVPLIIGTIGGANAGKTSYLGMLYTLLFNGRTFEHWTFSGSYSMLAWEKLAQYLRINPSGRPAFPEPTPANPGFYNLYHLALRGQDDRLQDIVFADSSGEVYTLWSENVHDTNAESARWIYEQSSAFIFFIDCVALIEQRGVAKMKIETLAQQVSARLNDRPIVVVWAKSDRKSEIRPNIKSAVEELIEGSFPRAVILDISNYSLSDPDPLCHQNNLKVTEILFDAATVPFNLQLSPELALSGDYFIDYRGRDGR